MWVFAHPNLFKLMEAKMLYKYLRELWKNPKEIKGILRERLIKWRREPSIVKVERPIRLDRARSVGYKAKEGFLIARVRVKRGGRKREKFKGGRRSKAMRRKKIVGKNYQWIAEERANRKFKNFEVLNSYYLAQDGVHYWFEIILIDPCHPAIKKDKNLKWICEKKHKGRAFRGKTSAGRSSRGLRHKGRGTEKIRPSLAAHGKKGK